MFSRSELQRATFACRSAFVGIAVLSGAVNILYLTGSFYMLEVYDRVVPSRSVPTLIGISIIAAFLFVFHGLLDIVRHRILARIGAALDARLSARVCDVIARLPLQRGAENYGMAPLRDFDQVKGFVSSPGPTAFFDLPWIPLYLGICFAFHPLVGLTTLSGATVLFILAIFTESASRRPARIMAQAASARMAQAEAIRANAEVVRALGMQGSITERWSKANDAYRVAQQKAADIVSCLSGFAKTLRMMLQAAVLGLGAWLVIHEEATAGIIIASSILTSRALAPVELAIANWKGFIAARQAWGRLKTVLTKLPETDEIMELPRPCKRLSVNNASAVPPTSKKPVLVNVSFEIEAGHAVGIIGPSASGKSSLARLLTGVWSPERGTVRLDGATLDQWSVDTLGPYVGYLPQDVELFAGSIKDNIARFSPQSKPEQVIAAATAAGAHELILSFADGYETEIGEGGAFLSAGQQQRIALARALYGDPFLVVLDEPNSNLDAEGEAALSKAIMGVRDRKGIVVVIAHRPSALSACDLALMLANGQVVQFGPKEDVLKQVLRPMPNVAAEATQTPPVAITKLATVGGNRG
jgi:PrtD family type I secretion system ABC transporter